MLAPRSVPVSWGSGRLSSPLHALIWVARAPTPPPRLRPPVQVVRKPRPAKPVKKAPAPNNLLSYYSAYPAPQSIVSYPREAIQCHGKFALCAEVCAREAWAAGRVEPLDVAAPVRPCRRPVPSHQYIHAKQHLCPRPLAGNVRYDSWQSPAGGRVRLLQP